MYVSLHTDEMSTQVLFTYKREDFANDSDAEHSPLDEGVRYDSRQPRHQPAAQVRQRGQEAVLIQTHRQMFRLCPNTKIQKYKHWHQESVELML